MSCVETCDRDSNHLTSVVQAELEPLVVSEVVRETLESASVVSVVVVIVRGLANRMMCRVSLEIYIRSFDYPSVVGRREVNCSSCVGIGSSNVVSTYPPVLSVDSGGLLLVVSVVCCNTS